MCTTCAVVASKQQHMVATKLPPRLTSVLRLVLSGDGEPSDPDFEFVARSHQLQASKSGGGALETPTMTWREFQTGGSKKKDASAMRGMKAKFSKFLEHAKEIVSGSQSLVSVEEDGDAVSTCALFVYDSLVNNSKVSNTHACLPAF